MRHVRGLAWVVGVAPEDFVLYAIETSVRRALVSEVPEFALDDYATTFLIEDRVLKPASGVIPIIHL